MLENEASGELIADVQEESSSKNPIRNVLRSDREHIDAAELVGIVACGRDFFHSFISRTVRRRYRRPPIYLVDSWVTKALGVFAMRGGIAIPSPEGWLPGSGPSAVFEGIGPVVQLFERLEQLRSFLVGLSLLELRDPLSELEGAALHLLEDPAELTVIEGKCAELSGLMHRAWQLLNDDAVVNRRVHPTFTDDLDGMVAGFVEGARRVAARVEISVPGVSFDSERGSGFLFGSIPELNIEGPAILLSPLRIRAWAGKMLSKLLKQHSLPPSARLQWFGARSDEHLAMALGICNVVQHELTHAMLALPNDAVQDPRELGAQRFAFYRSRPDVEEGMANFTAALCSVLMLMKANFSITGPALPVLHKGRYAEAFPEFDALMRATYAGYHDRSTDVFVHAWKQNKFDYGAFAGVIKLFSTNFGELNWPLTFEALERGEIRTGK